MLISVLTMTLGNIAALTQTNMKRLLAYSSIAHAGYLLMGVVALSENGARGLLVYLAAYVVMNLGAFLVVTLVHLHEGSFDLRDYPGLYRRAPLLTLAMAFFLLSLVGIPPFVGFLGKLYVFAAVIERGMGIYATIGALNAAVAAYYYFKILKVMTIDPGNEDKPAIKLAAGRSGMARRLRARQPRPAAVLGPDRGLGPGRARAVRGSIALRTATSPERRLRRVTRWAAPSTAALRPIATSPPGRPRSRRALRAAP